MAADDLTGEQSAYTGSTMATALKLERVSKVFAEVRAVDDLSLEIADGAFVGLLGRNGAGKSTTINLAIGLLAPTAGHIEVLGLDVARHALEVKRQVGMMAQGESHLDCLTGDQTLDLVGALYGLDRAAVEERRAELFEVLDLAPGSGVLVRDYSYGMKKKLALSAALIHGPRMVFLDEPFEGIDPVTSRTIRDLLVELNRRGVTILMSSHNLGLVERLCPQLAIIDRGRLLGFGTLDEVRAAHGSEDSLESLFVDLMGGARAGQLSWL